MSAAVNAIYSADMGRVAALVDQGMPVNGVNRSGSTPLYITAVQGEAEIVKLLLDAGADPNQESCGDSEGLPLCAAASKGRTDIVRLLLQYGADPNAVERAAASPMTALGWAERYGYSETAEALRDASSQQP